MPSNATNKAITASSSNTSVATVTSTDGTHFNVHLVATGTATISLKSADGGATKTISVTVS